MNDVQLVINSNGHGAFLIMEGREKIGEMVVAADDKNITVYHTEVDSAHEGKGLAKKLLDEMVAYARSKKLSVIPLCPYVHLQFKRHPDQYADIWNKTEEQDLS
ncbi:MAG: GNAT family N-acetyltransferase [Chitinophagaceae bacterium]